MKKLLVFFLISFYGFTQEKIILTKNGINPVVTKIDSMSGNDIYKKTKDWLQIYYKNPKEVLKADLVNDMIRIDGFCKDGYQTKSLGIINSMDYSYTIEISFKDGKYRYDYQINQLWANGKRCLYSYSDFFKKDGTIRSVYQLSYDTMTASINDNYISLYNYISGKTKDKKSDW